MLTRYVWAELVRNPRRTYATLIGVTLGVGLACAILFFVDGLSSFMTERAVAPLPIDMQLVQTDPVSGDVRLSQEVEPRGAVAAGRTVRVRLQVTNHGTTPATEVVVRSLPAPGFAYRAGSAVMDGRPIGAPEENPFASGPARMGFNLGTVAPGGRVELAYEATASQGGDVSPATFASTISSRSAVLPVAANTGKALGLSELAARIRAIDGVASAEELSYVDLPRGSLSGPKPFAGAVRLFGFDTSYAAQDPTIAIVEGVQAPGQALISAEVARSLSVGIGDPIALTLPDGTRLERPVSGIADLTRARSLFASRLGENLELFVYVPASVVVDATTFTDVVVPAFERGNLGMGGRIKTVPVREVDIDVRRDLLDAEPVAALARTERIASAVVAATEGARGRVQDRGVNQKSFLLDNISNTLTVARDDAAVAKRMFLFLSIPGAMLAALLGAYAGIVLAGAQRREQATLRVRGARRKDLLWMLGLRVAWITGAGAAIGLGIGYASVAAVLGRTALSRATPESLMLSAALGTVLGLLTTGSALYWTGRSSIDRGIQMDRLGASLRPMWQRRRLDLLGLAALVIATVVALRTSGFEGNAGSVQEGRGVELSLGWLLLPLGAWVAGTLFGGRLFAWLLSHLSTRAPQGPASPLSLLYWRSLKRRAWQLVVATLILGMIVALATSLAVFTASYDAAKVADARFTVGSDLRIVPRPSGRAAPSAPAADALAVEGIAQVVPVVYGAHNVRLRSWRTTDVANLAAIDPEAYQAVAPFEDAHFSNESADESLALLAKNRDAILLSEDIADFIKVREGDTVWVLVGRGTEEQKEIAMHVQGMYERLPGFPDGVEALMSLERYQEEVPSAAPAFFIAEASDGSDDALARATETLRAGPGAGDALGIDTRLTALAKDQSSLASLNINGLLKLDSAYSLAMGAVTIAIFVFGLLLQRRREYVTLRAQGMAPRAIQAFIGAEAGTAAIIGCTIGFAVGLAMAYYFISVLRPLFVLEPAYVVPVASLSAIVGAVLATTVITSVAASALVNQLQAMELLRDE